MPRYFVEVAYVGAAFSGFQRQENAHTVQSELENALHLYYRQPVELTGSSRTDAGVHAYQNYFHFDSNFITHPERDVYHLNAIVAPELVVKRIFEVDDSAHCRFDAQWRLYKYYLYQQRNPFLNGRAYYYPWPIRLQLLESVAEMIRSQNNFQSFSKRNTQVHNFACSILESGWTQEGDCMVYTVKANRFLRGMVRSLVATTLRVGRGKISLDEFEGYFSAAENRQAFFDVPAHGLFLCEVKF